MLNSGGLKKLCITFRNYIPEVDQSPVGQRSPSANLTTAFPSTGIDLELLLLIRIMFGLTLPNNDP